MTRRPEVRTSITHALRVDWLDAPARIGMTLAPGVRDRSSEGFQWERELDVDLGVIRQAGTTALVCLLEDHEFARYGIGELGSRAQACGLEVLRLPIADGGVPRTAQEVDSLLNAMEAHEAKGGRVVIHCRGGLGRTGTIAACYLVRKGMSPAEALATTRRVRKSKQCPEPGPQELFIERYAEHVAARRRAVAQRESAPATAPSAWYATVLGGLETAEKAAIAKGSKTAVAELISKIEREVAASPESCFAFGEDGEATLAAAGSTFAAGRFTTPTIGELSSRLAARSRNSGGRLVLSVLHGAHPLTDIGTLQATAPSGTLFQVASQFNCLEAPGPHIVPVRAYLNDNTQGPRASISAFPGTFLRHYRAPSADGPRFVQTDTHCLNLLGDAFDSSVAEVRSGYLQTSLIRDMDGLAKMLVDRFDHLRVGVHAGVEVVFGHDWSGPVPKAAQRIAQVFTSTMALGGYGRDDGSTALVTARRQLLRAAYLGTLFAALDLGSETVVLTMIGGGVFGNPHRDIWDAIHWAIAEVEPLVSGTTQVLVNTREPVAEADRAQVRARGGVLVEFSDSKIEVLR